MINSGPLGTREARGRRGFHRKNQNVHHAGWLTAPPACHRTKSKSIATTLKRKCPLNMLLLLFFLNLKMVSEVGFVARPVGRTPAPCDDD